MFIHADADRRKRYQDVYAAFTFDDAALLYDMV